MQASGIDRPIFTIDAATGWIDGVRMLESPNCDDRPCAEQPSLIVIHGISLPPGEFGGGWIDALFTNVLPGHRHAYFAEIAHLRVSSHVAIERGGRVTQYVSFLRRAWHAGESSYCGKAACNDYSVGIELEGVDDRPYTSQQYRVLAALIRALRDAYPELREAAIVGHCDIAPGRKTDPGSAFEWPRLHELLS
ncbi:MAG TPA: 1,6-anhydro-N-acetylmuramyl-L-alanine amidase AmpD [Gammaproteobacteria bacterium]|nr:1,6-anhydro-N-acetylmuramyl-L-alanine amidase AmpD [Gammaproteobacteria bacterium]